MRSIFAAILNIILSLFGTFSCIAVITFLLLSIPVYIYRVVVIYLAKLLRPDLDHILSDQTPAFIGDYFSATPPRSNLVMPSIFEGHFEYEEFAKLVQQRWIERRMNSEDEKPYYKKFQQFPVKWLGFTFWKHATDTFAIDKHVHKLSGMETQITRAQLDEICENLLNSRLPPYQSPWDFYVIENFHSSEGTDTSAIIFRYHHILADGQSIFRAFVEGLFEDYSVIEKNSHITQTPERSIWQNFTYRLLLPVSAIWQISYFLSHAFRKSPWKISDERKKWHQIYVKADPIPIQVIKDIKNKAGVSFTSVIMTAISAALTKAEENFMDKKSNKLNHSIPCLSPLPLPGQRKNDILTNRMTAILFDIPIKHFVLPEDRLFAVHREVEKTKRSVIPLVGYYYSMLLSLHCNFIVNLFSNNKMIPISVSSFPGFPSKLKLNGKAILDGDLILGGFHGDSGLVITVLSHDQNINFGIIAELGLLPRKDVQKFANFITEEIDLLRTSFGV